MLKKILFVLLFLLITAAIFLVVSYRQMNAEVLAYAPIEEGFEDRIVFFDIGDGDREFLAALIDSIQQCDPKVLAVDIFFKELKDERKDSLLKKSLGSPNVVLATRHDGKQTHAVHESFLKLPGSYGYAQSVQEGRFTSDAFYLRQAKSHHFAYEIARQYDSAAALRFKLQNRSQPIKIVFTRQEKQFKLYSFGDFDFNCEDIRGKIAYMGYFGENEDLHVTRARHQKDTEWISTEEGKPDMHGSVVVANQVLMILDDVKQPDS